MMLPYIHYFVTPVYRERDRSVDSAWTAFQLALCGLVEDIFQQPLSDDVWAAVWAQATFHTVLYPALMWLCELCQVFTEAVW